MAGSLTCFFLMVTYASNNRGPVRTPKRCPFGVLGSWRPAGASAHVVERSGGLHPCCPHSVGDRVVLCRAMLVSAEGQFWVTIVVRQLATNMAHCVSLVSAFLSV